MAIDEEERLIKDVVASNIDGEDFEDLASLAHGIANSVEDAEAVFKDLYNAYYDLQRYQFVNFDKTTVDEKRELILNYYLDPKGLKKSRENRGKSLYFNQTAGLKKEDILEKAKEVRFVHEDS